MYARVDLAHRMATSRAHTATHLLHTYLADIIPTTKQAGSRVGADELRFDFTSERLLTYEELQHVQAKVNEAIYKGFPVVTKQMAQEEAIKGGAKAFFGDKYDAVVRVVIIQELEDQENNSISMELCGGVHVKNTGQIGAFVIVGQEAVASGVKRIVGYTGPKVVEYYNEKANILRILKEKCEVASDTQVPEKVEKILKELASINSRLLSMEGYFIEEVLKKIFTQVENYRGLEQEGIDISINMDAFPGLQTVARDVLIAKCKEIFSDYVVLLYKQDGSFILLSSNPTRSVKQVAIQKGRKGGGNDQVFQGKDVNILSVVDVFKKNK